MNNIFNKITGTLGILALTTALFTASCTKDNDKEALSKTKGIGFAVNSASIKPQTKSTANYGDFIGSVQMTPQEQKNDAPKMYVHAYLSDIEDNMNTTPATKGTVTKDKESFQTLYATAGFGLVGYVNPNNDQLIGERRQGAKATYDTDSKMWSSSSFLSWGDNKMSFYAYAPFTAPNGGSLDITATSGNLTIAYENPTDIANQVDLRVATALNVTKPENNIVPLTFTPALTAVAFKVGKNFKDGKILSISLKNVERKGRFDVRNMTWSLNGILQDYVLEVNKSYTAAEDAVNQTIISGNDEIMFVLPQTFEDYTPVIEVKYAKSSDLNTPLTFSAPLKATGEWPRGKMITYAIAPTLDAEIPVFDIDDIPTFSYSGGTDIINITSQTKKNGEVVNDGVPWSVEYSTDEGATYSATAPAWLSIAADGNNNAVLSVVPQTDYTVATSGDEKWSPAKGTAAAPYNLANQTDSGEAVENTANCYIINAPGYYKIPLVYGNAVKNGAANTPAYTSDDPNPFMNGAGKAITSPYICTMQQGTVTGDIVWQDSQDLVTNVGITGSGENAFITFEVPEASMNQGNAVIAAKIDGVVAWSWHIWATDYRLGEGDVTINSNVFMPYNLGWCHFNPLTVNTYAERKCKVKFIQSGSDEAVVQDVISSKAIITEPYGGNNAYYNWGRKDPFPGCEDNRASVGAAKTTYGNWSIVLDDKHSYDEAIQNPGVLYSSFDDWRKTSDDKAWNTSVKTIYDPSPVGYCVPEITVFNGFSLDAAVAASDNKGYLWGDLFLPVTGQRDELGELYGFNSSASRSRGWYWSASPFVRNGVSMPGNHLTLSFNGTSISAAGTTGQFAGYGMSVRCVREK